MKQTASVRIGLGLCLVGALLLGTLIPAAATVNINGKVEVWNPIKNRYEGLKNARVRVVLAEYNDWDTLDKETDCDSNGNYSTSKGNAWWRSGYDAYLIVFAEVSNKLEVQSHYMQVDGYQAHSSTFFARDSRTTTKNMKIGGPSPNVSRYKVGGVAALNNADNTSSTRGYRAFFICHEMTDHRTQLVDDALSNGNFEEKEVSYPAGDATASYVGVLDYIKFPDHYFTSGTYERASLTCRHELSHGIMADEYWTWPGWMQGSAGSHTLDKVAEHHEFAWSEAWAEFMAEVTHTPRYGGYYDFETQDASWRSGIPSGADRSKVEGEVASAMWDIHDGRDWEKRYEQVAALPGDEMFYDGLADSNLTKIWDIFSDHHPHSFTHGTYFGSQDSLVWYWLNRTSFGQKHELKAVLFNRGINWSSQLPQHRPGVSVGTITWTGNTARIPVTVTEQDSEDRPNVRLEIFLNGVKVDSQRLASGWSGSTNNRTVNQEIVWRQGDPQPRLIVAAHDDMQSSHVSRTLDPPANAEVDGLVAEILSVSVRRTANPAMAAGMAGPLRDIVLTVQATDGASSRDTRVPASGSWTIPTSGEINSDETRELYRIGSLRDHLQLRFTASARDDQGSLSNTVTDRHDRASNYGLGTHTTAVLHHSRRWTMVFITLSTDTRVEVIYRIRAWNPVIRYLATAELLQLIRPVPLAAGVLQATRRVAPGAAIRTGVRPGAMTLAVAEDATPSALLARSSQLMDEYATLQGELVEMAEELEHKLGSESPPAAEPSAAPTLAPAPTKSTQILRRGPTARVGIQKGGRATPERVIVAAPNATVVATGVQAARLIKPELQLRSGLLMLPETRGLEQLSRGQLAVTRLNANQRSYLQELNEGMAAREARLNEIDAQSVTLNQSLGAAMTKIQNAAELDAASKNEARSRIVEMTGRLSEVRPSVAGYKNLLQMERQGITRGLQLAR